MSNDLDWVDKKEEKDKEERAKLYFNIEEGENKFFVLSYIEPLALVYSPSEKKYRLAEDGEKATSIKGLCWVLQDDTVKQAKLPYTVVKSLRAYQRDNEWELADFPWPHQVTLTAKNAGTKEVEYSVTLSPRKTDFTPGILEELEKKRAPSEIKEKMKEQAGPAQKPDYPEEDIDTSSVPF